MKPFGLSANALSRHIGVPANRVTQIINGQRAITADTAMRFAKAFKTTPNFWLNLQSNYELEIVEQKLGDIEISAVG